MDNINSKITQIKKKNRNGAPYTMYFNALHSYVQSDKALSFIAKFVFCN